jgi:hypothetical protein
MVVVVLGGRTTLREQQRSAKSKSFLVSPVVCCYVESVIYVSVTLQKYPCHALLFVTVSISFAVGALDRWRSPRPRP